MAATDALFTIPRVSTDGPELYDLVVESAKTPASRRLQMAAESRAAAERDDEVRAQAEAETPVDGLTREQAECLVDGFAAVEQLARNALRRIAAGEAPTGTSALKRIMERADVEHRYGRRLLDGEQ